MLALIENYNSLLAEPELTHASGHVEQLTAMAVLDGLSTTSKGTLAGDRGSEAESFVLELRERWITPDVARRDLQLPAILAKLDKFDLLILNGISYVRKEPRPASSSSASPCVTSGAAI